MRGTLDFQGAGDAVEAAVSVAVEGEGTMVLEWKLSMMLEAITKKHHEVLFLLSSLCL